MTLIRVGNTRSGVALCTMRLNSTRLFNMVAFAKHGIT